MNQNSLLQLLRFTSPALPIGAFAWSQGLEGVVEHGWIENEHDVLEWINGLAEHMLAHTDLPVMLRVYALAAEKKLDPIQSWNDTLLAMRESHELWLEDTQLGAALKRLLVAERPDVWFADIEQPSYAVLFAITAQRHGIETDAMLAGFLWTWAENLVAAAIKIMPLGQSAGQRVLNGFIENAPRYAEQTYNVTDAEIGSVMPGLAMVSAWHEQQYSRLFRS